MQLPFIPNGASVYDSREAFLGTVTESNDTEFLVKRGNNTATFYVVPRFWIVVSCTTGITLSHTLAEFLGLRRIQLCVPADIAQ